MIVVSDSGPLISLMKAGQLDLLQNLYGEILIPEAVFTELTTNEKYTDEAEEIKSSAFIRIVSVSERKAVDVLKRANGLDLGESEAIVYADDNKADVLLIEDGAGRRVAKSMGIRVRGAIGILLLGFDKKILTADDIDLATDMMKAANRYISDGLYNYAREYVRK